MARPVSTKVGQKRKRQPAEARTAAPVKKSKRREEDLDEELDSDVVVSEGEDSDADDRETAAQKRVRLARMYLDHLASSKRRGSFGSELPVWELDSFERRR
jgi:hypothetical protein